MPESNLNLPETLPNVTSAFKEAATRLADAGIESPRREASSLLIAVLGRPAAYLIAHPEYELTREERLSYILAVDRRTRREPFHYIVGTKEFYGLDFLVGPGVLIPRRETEFLVEAAIELLTKRGRQRFLEIGVGSGCIAISILHHLSSGSGLAVDISEAALNIAALNIRNHGMADRLTLDLGDIYDGINEKFDLIVSNPPYIPDGDLGSLQPEVARFEPDEALFAGRDGLDIVRKIMDRAPEFLYDAGAMLIEIGFGQAPTVRDMVDSEIWRDVDFIKDMQGIDRILRVRLRD